MAKPKQYLHVVWSPTTGPLYAYWRPDVAHDHARTMVGVNVDAAEVREQAPSRLDEGERAQLARLARDVRVAEVEALDQLPPFVLDDIESDNFDSAEMTPIELHEIDEDKSRGDQ